jgi:hypothetical protein
MPAVVHKHEEVPIDLRELTFDDVANCITNLCLQFVLERVITYGFETTCIHIILCTEVTAVYCGSGMDTRRSRARLSMGSVILFSVHLIFPAAPWLWGLLNL